MNLYSLSGWARFLSVMGKAILGIVFIVHMLIVFPYFVAGWEGTVISLGITFFAAVLWAISLCLRTFERRAGEQLPMPSIPHWSPQMIPPRRSEYGLLYTQGEVDNIREQLLKENKLLIEQMRKMFKADPEPSKKFPSINSISQLEVNLDSP